MQPIAPSPASGRLWQIDALRGLMLVLMTCTHLPTRFASPLGQPFGFVSAAEGFVLLSGFMAGMVYSRRHQRDGEPVMRAAFLRRAIKIYACQGALLLFLFSAVTLIALAMHQVAVTNLLSFYIEKPLAALFGALLLIYNPPLLDILPMYILFMLVSPVLLVHGLHQGWVGILGVSIALWAAEQFGLGKLLYDAASQLVRLPIPFQQTGAFATLAWQLLWVIGLWLGAQRAGPRPPAPLVFPRWTVVVAVVVGATGFVWRHAIGQVPTPHSPELAMLFDKWQLAPLRLLDLFALVTLTIHFAPWLTRRLPRVRALEVLGAASLPVFCAHLVLALLVLALLGEPTPERAWWVDAAILVGSFAILYGVALVSQQLDRQAKALTSKARAARHPPAAQALPGAPK